MNILYFETLNDVNNFVITDIPFVAYCAENLLTLYCKESDKRIVVSSGQMSLDDMFVDLGLSVKWAKCNLGAETETDYGDYYAWGEVETKSDYSWATYTRHTNGTYSDSNKKVFIKYIPTSQGSTYWAGTGSVDNKLTLEAVDDVATQTLGGNWRMPTEAECNELLDTTKVTNVWVRDYKGSGINGREFTSLINGNKLFIPAAGYYNGSSLLSAGIRGGFWDLSLNLSYPRGAYYINFFSDGIYTDWGNRYYGRSIRPVFAN